MKIWICRSAPRGGFRNTWTRIKNVNGAIHLSKSWNFFGKIQIIYFHDWWPRTKPGYITMTQKQSNSEWTGGIVAHLAPKNSECKNPLENFSPRFFGTKAASFSLFIFQRANLSTRSITHFCWCNWRTFWRKNAAGCEGHERGLVLLRHCPSSPGTCNPKETGLPGLPMSWSPTLFSGSVPVGLPPFPGTEKQLKFRHLSFEAEVIAATETWLDGQTSEFLLSGLQKLEQRAK